jgi:hypothetical protein
MKLVFSIFLSLLIHPAFGEDQIGRIYFLGKTGGEPAYIQKIHNADNPDGISEHVSSIVDAKGALMITETAKYKGSHLIAQSIDNYQIGKSFTASVDKNEVTFTTYSLKIAGDVGRDRSIAMATGATTGEKKELSHQSEDISDGFITGPVSLNFIKEHWDQLVKGERVKTRFSVFEREETIGFAFKKKGTEKVKDHDCVILEMRPSSFFVSMLVSPVEIALDMKDKTLIRYRGRTSLQTMKDGKMQPLEAEIFYGLADKL